MSQKILISEVGPRDGLQSIKSIMPLAAKKAWIDAEAAAGVEGAAEIVCDVSDPAAVAAMMAEVTDRFGRLDALVNNAAVAEFAPLGQTDFEMWRRVMATNLDGVFLVSQAAAPALCASRGAIVNIASISGLRASTLRVAYGTSKGAVIQLTRQQAAELGEAGVACRLAPAEVV